MRQEIQRSPLHGTIGLAIYAAGMVMFFVSAFLACTSVGPGLVAGFVAILLFFCYPFHAMAIIATLSSPIVLPWIRKGKLRRFWAALAFCLPAIWVFPIAALSGVPRVGIHAGYFIWALATSLVALSLALMTHQAKPLETRPRKVVTWGLAAIILTCAFIRPHYFLPRFWQLQFAGELPANACSSDAVIAQGTSWWGKPLGPEKFWNNMTVWNDDVAEMAAHRHGRWYPPIPTHLTNLITGFPLRSRNQATIVPDWQDCIGGPDSGSGGPVYLGSDADGAYWNWFWRTKPKPPPVLEREQVDVALRIYNGRQPLIWQGKDMHGNAMERECSESCAKQRAREIGVPPEALTEEALFWAYVMSKRKEYVNEEATAWGQRLQHFLARLAVDPALITDPLRDDQLKAANAWKICYLRRLRQEQWDDSYIRSYVQAWNLSSNDIYGAD
jgi:hypothetical protein